MYLFENDLIDHLLRDGGHISHMQKKQDLFHTPDLPTVLPTSPWTNGMLKNLDRSVLTQPLSSHFSRRCNIRVISSFSPLQKLLKSLTRHNGHFC